MRHSEAVTRCALIPSLAFALLLAGCGGVGADTLSQASGRIPYLNPHEETTTGACDLTGFPVQKDGVGMTGDRVEGDADVVAAWALTADGTLQTRFVQPETGGEAETRLSSPTRS